MKKIRIIKNLSAVIALLVLCGTVLTGCSSKNPVVMRVGGLDINYDQYRYMFMNFYDEHIDAGETTAAASEAAKASAVSSICRTCAVELLAKEHGVELDESDRAAVSSEYSASVEQYGGEEAFAAELRNNYLSEAFFKRGLSLRYLESRLYERAADEASGIIMSDDATVEADVKENFWRAKQIFISNDTGEDYAKNLELAQELLVRAQMGEDFDALIQEYSEDGNDEGYCFTAGQLLAPFEEAVKATGIGEIYPKVVRSDEGYHIVWRLAIDDEYINGHFEELRTAFKARRVNELIEEKSTSLTVEYTKLFETLTVSMLTAGTVE